MSECPDTDRCARSRGSTWNRVMQSIECLRLMNTHGKADLGSANVMLLLVHGRVSWQTGQFDRHCH